MGYHSEDFEPVKGTVGEFSKIKEEFLELEDAVNQDCKILQIVELSDLVGAIELYSEKLGVTLEDLIKFSKKTQSAFKNGSRN